MKKLINDLVWLVIRFWLGGVFVYSGWTKMMEPSENFRYLLMEYTVIPDILVPIFVMAMPWMELILGVFVITGFMLRLSALGSAGIFFSFVVVLLISKWALGNWPTSCGCFGETGWQVSVPQIIVLDILNTFLCLRIFQIRKHGFSLDRWLCR